MKRLIYGMADSKSDIAARIESCTFPVMCAIAQLYVFPNSQYENHWRTEVWSNFHEMTLLKRKNKLPKASFIMDNSWNVNKKFVADAVKRAITKESELSPREDLDINQLTDIMQSYFEYLATVLSKSRYISPDEVYAKLDELNL